MHLGYYGSSRIIWENFHGKIRGIGKIWENFQRDSWINASKTPRRSSEIVGEKTISMISSKSMKHCQYSSSSMRSVCKASALEYELIVLKVFVSSAKVAMFQCLMCARHSLGDLHRAETVTAQELTLGILLRLLGEISILFQRLLSADVC